MTASNGLDLPTDPHVSEGPDNDGFFTDIADAESYLKAGIEGFAASGKTFTMIEIAIGLHRRIGSTKPVVYVDTESAAKFAKPRFREAKIPVLLRKTRSPADLIEVMRRCREGLAEILIVDSMSHFWEAFVKAYRDKHNKKRLDMTDWGNIKPQWKEQVMDPFVRDPYHYLFTGRSGYEYDSEIVDGKREIFKSGVKMKMEGETAYEPDLLIFMARIENLIEGKKEVYREATILKDRANIIDGKTFRDPSYKQFADSIDWLLSEVDPNARQGAPERDATALFKTEEDRRQWLKRRDIALENIEAELATAWPGQTGEAKAQKLRALELAYGTKSWTKITDMKPEQLEAGMTKIRDFVSCQKLIEAIDADLVAIYPGTSMDAKLGRKGLLRDHFGGVETVDALDRKTLQELTAGVESMKAKVAAEKTAAAS